MSSMGVHDPAQLAPHHLMRRVDEHRTLTYAELYPWLSPGELLSEPPKAWAADWARADADSFV
jgi:hypothetical protein